MLIDLAGRSVRLRKRAFDKLSELVNRNETLVTTRFNLAELYIGIARSDEPRVEEAAVRGLIADLSILEFDDKAAWLFGQITAHLQNLGRPAGDMDVLIAATAMVAGHSMITRDISHFANIPQLTVENY
jgi:tRNA(fMet)-specific endonuclease VapC